MCLDWWNKDRWGSFRDVCLNTWNIEDGVYFGTTFLPSHPQVSNFSYKFPHITHTESLFAPKPQVLWACMFLRVFQAVWICAWLTAVILDKLSEEQLQQLSLQDPTLPLHLLSLSILTAPASPKTCVNCISCSQHLSPSLILIRCCCVLVFVWYPEDLKVLALLSFLTCASVFKNSACAML